MGNRLKRTELKADKVLCQHSYYEFFKCAWHILHPKEELIDNWHIKYLCDKLQAITYQIKAQEKKDRDLIINIPPRSLKSMIVTIMWNAWSWIVYPEMKFITSSYSAGLSIDHSGMTKQIIESDWYQYLWPDIQLRTDQRATSKYANVSSGSRRATSVGGTITGAGADVVIADDPINPKKAASERERHNCISWWKQTMSTRLNNQEIGVRIIVMQRLHEDDLTGHLLSRDSNYEYICIPGENTNVEVSPKVLNKYYVDNLFFGKRFNRYWLNNLLTELGSQGYAGQILQIPAPQEGNMIKRGWFSRFNLSDLENKAKLDEKQLIWNFTIDGAYTKDEQNDASAILCYCQFENNLYVRDVISLWDEFPELIKYIPEHVNRHGYNNHSKIYIEPKASGLSAAQTLRRDTSLNVIIGKSPTTDKIARTNSASPFMESKRVYLLHNAGWIDSFIHQCCTFPNAKNDDELDTLLMAIDKVQSKDKVISFEVI